MELGSSYGAMPAHDGLWESAAATAHSLPARLAVEACVHEARGLDVLPQTIARCFHAPAGSWLQPLWLAGLRALAAEPRPLQTSPRRQPPLQSVPLQDPALHLQDSYCVSASVSARHWRQA